MGLVNLQGDQTVFQLPRLRIPGLRRLARGTAGLGPQIVARNDAVVLHAQGARLRRAIREQGAGNFRRFFFPTGTRQQAHAGQFLLLGPVHAHQSGQVVGCRRLRVVLAQPIVPGGVAAQPLGTPPANGFSTERLGAAIDRAAGGGAVPPVPVVIGSPNAGAVIGSTAPAAAPLAASPMTAVTPVMPAPAVPLAPRSSSGPNIVDFALKTSNPVGTPVYSRSSLQLRSAESACAAFASADLAQTAFLEAGGPDKDRKGLDPDGDGFACSWDPSPFRNAVQ